MTKKLDTAVVGINTTSPQSLNNAFGLVLKANTTGAENTSAVANNSDKSSAIHALYNNTTNSYNTAEEQRLYTLITQSNTTTLCRIFRC